MSIELLSKLADVVNTNSKYYHAVIPSIKHEYMTQQGNKLVKTCCLVLRIMMVGKVKNHKKRTVWNIFEADIEKIIGKISKRDSGFAERMRQCCPTPMDVEILIRRSSLQSLKLNLSRTTFSLYQSN